MSILHNIFYSDFKWQLPSHHSMPSHTWYHLWTRTTCTVIFHFKISKNLFFYFSRTENQQKVIFKSIQEKFSFIKNLHKNYNFWHFYIAPLFLCEKHEKLSSSTLKLEKSGLRFFFIFWFFCFLLQHGWGGWIQPKVMVFLPLEFKAWNVSYRLDLYWCLCWIYSV